MSLGPALQRHRTVAEKASGCLARCGKRHKNLVGNKRSRKGAFEDVFASGTDGRYVRITFWLPPGGAGRLTELETEIEQARVFQAIDGRWISWNPIHVVTPTDPQDLVVLQTMAAKEQEHQLFLNQEISHT